MNIIINTKKRIKNTFPGTNYNFFVIGTKNYFTINNFSSLKTFAKIDDIFKILSDSEDFLYLEEIINFQIDNFVWFCRLNNYNSANLKGKKIKYFKNKFFFSNNIKPEKVFPFVKKKYYINKLPYKAVLMLHWGWTDLLVHVGMINYYLRQFSELTLICLRQQKEFLEFLYPKNKLIFVDDPDKGYIDNLAYKFFQNDYVLLLDGHQSSQCLTMACLRNNFNPKSHIQKVNYKNINSSANNYIDIIKKLDKLDSHFDERISFYTLANIDKNILFDFFKIFRNHKSEKLVYNNIVKCKNYAVAHSTNGMNINTKLPIIYLNERSSLIIDMLKVIENAKEIHIYDSLYGVLVYLLYFSGNFKKNIKIYYHLYARNKIPKFFNMIKIYKSKNWTVLNIKN